jgi:HAD superfamily hydrolase (TIGR01459 family)
MATVIKTLADISARYDAVFCDLWGCLHDGVVAFPEAIEALQAYRQTGGKVILLTNSPRPRDQVALQLDELGAPRDCWDDIATSGDSAQAAMMAGAVGRRVWHLGPERDMAFFTDLPPELAALPPVVRVPLDAADGIVCTGLLDDTTEAPEDYRGQLLLAKIKGLKLLCANPDVIVDRGDQRVFCAGALAALYTEMGGVSLYFGKPHPPIYDLARRRLAALDTVPDDRILAIGDGPGTDVAGAIGEDLDCLFVSGGLAAAQTGTSASDGPDPALLDAYLTGEKLSPLFAIARLR